VGGLAAVRACAGSWLDLLWFWLVAWLGLQVSFRVEKMVEFACGVILCLSVHVYTQAYEY
jgi:hypothetical protein